MPTPAGILYAGPDKTEVHAPLSVMRSTRWRYAVISCHATPPRNTKGYSSTYLAMEFANVRAGTRYPPEHERIP